MLTNQDVARTFSRVAVLLTLQGENRRRIMAYERAANAVSALEQDIQDVWRRGALENISGIGETLAAKIEEMLTSGKLELDERLQREVPPGVVEMLSIPEIGPRRAARFWKELGVTSVDALEEAAREGRVRAMSRMGAKTERSLLENIAFWRRWQGQVPLGRAWVIAYSVLDSLAGVSGVERAAVGGGVRRFRDAVQDIDIIISASDRSAVVACLRAHPAIDQVLSNGDVLVAARTQDGIALNVHLADLPDWGSCLLYHTGSRAHNALLGRLALDQGYRWVRGRLERLGKHIVAKSEQEIYDRLGLFWIPPEVREGAGEFDPTAARLFSSLVERSDLKGDLQMHTTGSDGHQSIAQMAEAARANGLQYVLITDHSQSLGVAGGQSVPELRQQRSEIRALNARFDNLCILSGTEVEIKADGSLDYPDEVLAELDLVVASLHTGHRSSRDQVTHRMLAAIRNPHVDIIAHPTNRLIGHRAGLELDMQAILGAANEMGTALEINAHPDRLDLCAEHIKMAVEAGVKLAISSDAHDVSDLGLLFFGVGTARRGWASRENVINTWDLDRLLAWAGNRV